MPEQTKPVDLDALMAAEAAGAHPVLSAKEVADAKAKARAAVDKARKDAATKQLIEQETVRLQREEGLVAGDPVADELVKLTVDLPEHAANITVNMQPFWHGHTYDVPRHVANSLREQMQRAWAHQHEIDGKNLTQHYQMARETVLSPVAGVRNAPQVAA